MKKLITVSVVTLMALPATAMAEGADQARMMQRQQTGQYMNINQGQLRAGTVMDIQQSLRQHGFNPGPVDGIYGPRTAAAVRNFQQATGLQPTGQPQPATLAQLGVQDTMGVRSGAQMQTAAVMEIQQALRQSGFNPGPVDGIYGPRTAAAIRNFQQATGLQPTGQLNTDTVNRLGVRGSISGNTQIDTPIDPLGATRDQMRSNPAGQTSTY